MAGPRPAPLHPPGLPAPLAVYLATVADRLIERAVSGWRGGIPRYEMALLNRVTEPFNGLSLLLPSPPGMPGPYLHMSSELYQLHGLGGRVPGQPRGSDAYGADLAVTVDAPPFLKKTGFLQFKKTDQASVVVEAKQLRQAKRFAQVWERSFFVVADERKASWAATTMPVLVSRSEDVQALLSPSSSSGSVSLHQPNWHPVSVWLAAWLLCQVGPATLPDDPDQVEGRLARFAESMVAAPEEEAELVREQYPEFARLQGWLRANLNSTEA